MKRTARLLVVDQNPFPFHPAVAFDSAILSSADPSGRADLGYSIRQRQTTLARLSLRRPGNVESFLASHACDQALVVEMQADSQTES